MIWVAPGLPPRGAARHGRRIAPKSRKPAVPLAQASRAIKDDRGLASAVGTLGQSIELVRRVAPLHPHPVRRGSARAARVALTLGQWRALMRGCPRDITTRRCPAATAKPSRKHMWSDGGPIDPSPTIDQAINGGFPWLEIECSRCKTPRDVDLCALRHVPTTCVHDLVGRLIARTPASSRPQRCSSLRRANDTRKE
jgi:hypothetical protein